MSTFRKPLSLAVLATAAAALSACGSVEASPSESGVVKVGTLRAQPHLYTPYLYSDFAPEGLEYEIVLFDTSTDIKNAVVSGSVDFGVTGVPSALAGQSAGQDVRIIASSADGGTRIAGDTDIESVEDLKGKKIGYPMGASQEILLKLTLENNGIDPEIDVELVNLPFADMANAWESGQIDAMSSAEIGPSIAVQAGAHDIVSPYDTPVGRVNIGLITTGELIESDADLVQDVVDTHIQATEHLNEDTQAWVDGMVAEFDVDASVLETATENIWPRYSLDEEYQSQVHALAAEMVAFDQLESEPAEELVFDTTFVEASDFAD